MPLCECVLYIILKIKRADKNSNYDDDKIYNQGTRKSSKTTPSPMSPEVPHKMLPEVLLYVHSWPFYLRTHLTVYYFIGYLIVV